MRSSSPLAQTPVGLGEIRVVTHEGGILVAHGLGSCVALCLWDPGAHIGGMAHIALPNSPRGAERDGRYADQAVPWLIRELIVARASPQRLVAKMAGGSSILEPWQRGELIGYRNVVATREALARLGFQLAAADVGGKTGRTVRFHTATGKLTIHKLGCADTII